MGLEFEVMKKIFFLTFFGAIVFLASCSTPVLPETALSAEERSLLTAINQSRQEQGKLPFEASESLTSLARQDAQRRVEAEGGYVNQRGKTGYERMLTLSGRSRKGEDFGKDLMSVRQQIPLQRQWVGDDYAGVGVGTATGTNGVETGVVLLGGFSGGGL